MATDDKTTARQQRYLRSLAQSTGTSFTPPATKHEASREIDRLKALTRSPRHEHRTDRRAVEEAPRGGATRVDESEIAGYGSATWGVGRVER